MGRRADTAPAGAGFRACDPVARGQLLAVNAEAGLGTRSTLVGRRAARALAAEGFIAHDPVDRLAHSAVLASI